MNSTDKKLSPTCVRYFLIIFIGSILLLGKILWPFCSILVLAFFFTNIFHPVYGFFQRRIPRQAASALTCLLITTIVFVPLVLFTFALTGEALSLYQWGRGAHFPLKIQQFLQQSPFILSAQTHLAEFGFELQPEQLTDSVSYLAKTAGLFLYNQASSWAANILQFVILFCMMILVIFFLLLDLPQLISFFIKLSPLPEDQDRLLLDKFQEIAGAVLKGNGISGIFQGLLGGIVFSFMGISSPILWGGVMAVLAFLPIFGIGLVMIPAAALLALNDEIGKGIFIFIFYIVLSGSIEYVIKPKLVGSQVRMHTLLVFLSIIGGLKVFGLLGIIYGPLIATAFITLSDIYFRNYNPYLQNP